jgi:hypothetical protein
VVENLNHDLEVVQDLDLDLDQDLNQGNERQQAGNLLLLQSVDAVLKQFHLLQTEIIMNNNIMLEQKM